MKKKDKKRIILGVILGIFIGSILTAILFGIEKEDICKEKQKGNINIMCGKSDDFFMGVCSVLKNKKEVGLVVHDTNCSVCFDCIENGLVFKECKNE